ncbi:putative RiPP precursor [Mesorhizobium ciceri]|nr:putative RiPP precursor [Mesorhizobium ciceri]
MKKTYEKPVLTKKDRLSAVTAGNGASFTPPPPPPTPE